MLDEGIFRHLHLVISCIGKCEDVFRRFLGAKKSAETKKKLAKAEKRLVELDKLFKRFYEDMVNERLSESRFQMLFDDYEREQANLSATINQLNTEISEQESQTDNVDKQIQLGSVSKSISKGRGGKRRKSTER